MGGSINWIILSIYLIPFAVAGIIYLAKITRNKIMHQKGYIKVYIEQPNKKLKSFYVKPESDRFEYQGKWYEYNPNYEYHIFHQGIMTTYYDKSKNQILFNQDPDAYKRRLSIDEASTLAFITAVKKLNKDENLKKMLLFVAAGGAVIAVIIGLMILGKIDDLMKVLHTTKVVVG